MLTVSSNIDDGNGNDNAKKENFGQMKKNSRAANAARPLQDSALFSAKQQGEIPYHCHRLCFIKKHCSKN